MNEESMQVSDVPRSKEQARSMYNRLSRWYDLLSGSAEAKLREAGLRKLAPKAGDVVLEIGFGTGHAIVALAKLVGETGKVYGIDISEGMLAVTQARLAKAGLEGRAVLQVGDAEQLPFEADFFDGIFSSFTLELFDTPEIPAVLAECRRTLRPGGRLGVVAMAKQAQPNLITRLYEWLHAKWPQYVDCRPIYVREALEAAGFRIVAADTLSLFGLGVAIVVGEKVQVGVEGSGK